MIKLRSGKSAQPIIRAI